MKMCYIVCAIRNVYATTAYVCVYIVYVCIFTVKVSSDEQFVRRATPLSEPDNIDDRTLYVVSLNNFIESQIE